MYERYYMRVQQKQVPVQFLGEEKVGIGSRRLKFRSLIDGSWLKRRSAGAISKHADNCAFWQRATCTCQKELESYADQRNVA